MFKSKATVELETTIKLLEAQLEHARTDLSIAQEVNDRLVDRNNAGVEYTTELEEKLRDVSNLNIAILSLEEDLAKANLLLANAQTKAEEDGELITSLKSEVTTLSTDVKNVTIQCGEFEVKSKYKDVEITELKRVNEVLGKTTIALEEWNKLCGKLEMDVASLTAENSGKDDVIAIFKENNSLLQSQLQSLTKILIEYQGKDPLVIEPQIVSPQVLEPTVISTVATVKTAKTTKTK